MDEQDKTFQQAIEELSKQQFPLSEEIFREWIISFAPIVQQALQDERPIESVAKSYFPTEGQYQMVAAIFQAALLRDVLDTALRDRRISTYIHKELLGFLSHMIER